MKKTLLILLVVGMFGWTVYEFVISKNSQDDMITSENSVKEQTKEQPVESDEEGIQEGQIALDFELETLDGETVKLSDFKGQRVMLNFWATWCPPCRAEMPDMQKFQDNKDVQILAVNLTETEAGRAQVENFMDELNLSMTVPMDEDSAVSTDYSVMAYPTTYMIDSNGRIQSVMMGAINYDLMVQQFEMMQ